MRRALLVSLIVCLACAADAAACSCIDPVESYDRAERAFVATVVEKREAADRRFVYTFAVEKVYKGDVPQRIEGFSSSRDEASCGMDLPVGRRTGLQLYGDNVSSAGICNLIPEQDLERLQKPFPEPAEGGRLALLAAGPFGSAGVVGLDVRGRLLAYGFGPRPHAISICPGSRYAVERAGAGLQVRRLSDLRIVRRPRLPGADSVRCLDRRAGDIVGFSARVVGEGPAFRGRLVRLRGGHRTSRALEGAAEATLGDRGAVIRTGALGRCEFSSVDYRTGLVRPVGKANGILLAMAISPRGGRLGALTSRINGPSQLHAFDLAGSGHESAQLPGEVSYGALAWQGEGRLLLAPGDDAGALESYDTALRRTARIDPWAAASVAVLGGRAYGLTGAGALVAAAGGRGRGTITTLPRGHGGPLVAVPAGPRFRGPRRVPR